MNEKQQAWGVRDTKAKRVTPLPEREHPNACKRRKKWKRRHRNKLARTARKETRRRK